MTDVTLNLSKFAAVIFDMDGTMINNADYHREAWKKFLRQHGRDITPEEYHQKFSGKKNSDILAWLFPQLSEEEKKQYAREKEQIYRELYAPHVLPVAGLIETIKTLEQKNLKLGLATTANKENREFILKALNLEEVFLVAVGDEDVTNGKPDPEIYLKAAEELKVPPEKCLVFEDSPSGVAAASGAGMTVVGINTRYTPQELPEADFYIPNYTVLKFA